MDKLINENGGYIFISHSHQDIKKVRLIRNRLEEEGFEPLCFYLKCLNDDDEIDDLVKREIDAREWFVFVDSPNSRASSWVQREREYISTRNDKQVCTVDLESGFGIEKISTSLVRGLRVFLSYNRVDRKVAEVFRQTLIRNDLQVFSDADIQAGDNWSEIIIENLNRLNTSGCLVVLLGKGTLKSIQMQKEIRNARDNNTPIFPISLGECILSNSESELLTEDIYVLPANPTVETMENAAKAVCRFMRDNLEIAISSEKSHSETGIF